MAHLVGETRTFFWDGDKFKFERVGENLWKCIYQEHPIIPADIIDEVEKLA